MAWREHTEGETLVITVDRPGLNMRSGFMLLWVLGWMAIVIALGYAVVARVAYGSAFLGPPSVTITILAVCAELVGIALWLRTLLMLLPALFLRERFEAKEGTLIYTRDVLGLPLSTIYDASKMQPIRSTARFTVFACEGRRITICDNLPKQDRDLIAARLMDALCMEPD